MHLIELSTVAFYEGRTPRSIALKDCSWPVASPPRTGLCGIYGSKSKPEAFMAARAHAERERLNFTVIDYVVALEQKPNPTVMKPPELSGHDFFSLLRMNATMGAQVAGWLQSDSAIAKEHAAMFETMKPEHVLMQAPRLIDALARVPECRHVRLFAFPAMTAVGDQPLNLGFVPDVHWSAIQEATCRLDPTLHVTLDAPAERAEARASASTTTKAASRPRTR